MCSNTRFSCQLARCICRQAAFKGCKILLDLPDPSKTQSFMGAPRRELWMTIKSNSETECITYLQRFSNQESRTDLKATHRLPIVKRASGDRAPVAALLVRSISSSDLPRLITTRMAVRSLLAEDVALAGLPAGTLPCLPIAVSALRDTCKQPLNFEFEVSDKKGSTCFSSGQSHCGNSGVLPCRKGAWQINMYCLSRRSIPCHDHN
jgi:hypothetical protein